jgi:DNA polymerase-3 subunit alpha
MRVASELAGFTLGQSDILRRAIGKKKADVLAQQRKLFIEGCLNNGLDEELAEKIYDLIVKFADYGFNKSHAAAYAVLAYQTAYLKANYPTEFLAALLTGSMGSTDKIALYIDDCKGLGIEVLPPDINESLKNFTVVDSKKIRFGLLAIKNLGQGIVDQIIEEREKNGPYESIEDFISRVYTLNRRALESLIKAGACDSLNPHRAQLLSSIDLIFNFCEGIRQQRESGQLSLFDMLGATSDRLELPQIPKFSTKESLALEKEALGLYITGHPLTEYLSIYGKGVSNTLEIKEGQDNQQVKVAGIVSGYKKIFTKTGKPMAFVELEDMYGTVEVVVFTEQFLKHLSKLSSDEPIIVSGRISLKEEEEAKVVCQEIFNIDEFERTSVVTGKKLYIRLNYDGDLIDKLTRILEMAKGDEEVFFYFADKKKVIKFLNKVAISPTLVECLGEIVGKENVKIS